MEEEHDMKTFREACSYMRILDASQEEASVKCNTNIVNQNNNAVA